MSDTPRTDAEYDNALEFEFDSQDRLQEMLQFSKKLERELNAANDRIKRLEDAGDAMINEGWNEPHLANAWRKAKEAKP